MNRVYSGHKYPFFLKKLALPLLVFLHSKDIFGNDNLLEIILVEL